MNATGVATVQAGENAAVPTLEIIRPAQPMMPRDNGLAQGEAETVTRSAAVPFIAPVALRPLHELDYTFDVRQQWEGIVRSIEGEEFSVTLTDLRDTSAPALEARLLVEEVSSEDLPLLVPGAVLYWTIGYKMDKRSGQRERTSSLRLRRLPAWSRQDIARVEERARALRGFFDAE